MTCISCRHPGSPDGLPGCEPSRRDREYLTRSPLEFPAFVLEDDTIAEWGFGVTPATIIVGRDGRVVKKFNGAWTAAGSLPIVEKFFGVKLPGESTTTEK